MRVLYDPIGNQELDCYWNICITYNNKVEAYALYQGVQLAKQRKISHLDIVGAPKNTIRYFVLVSSMKDIGLKKLVEHIRISLLNLKVQLFRVYHQHNSEENEMTNKAIGLAHGLMGVDGVESVVTPPCSYGLEIG
jgi:hypothetical protein